jgi:hypothetical protein
VKVVLDTSVLVGAFYGDHPRHPACLGQLEDAFKKHTFVRGVFKHLISIGFPFSRPCQRPGFILLASEYLRRPKPGKRTGQNAAAMPSGSAWIGRTLRARRL